MLSQDHCVYRYVVVVDSMDHHYSIQPKTKRIGNGLGNRSLFIAVFAAPLETIINVDVQMHHW
jgi:hypothetical protein